jgi:23S rRNA pseudouridine2605 synthase
MRKDRPEHGRPHGKNATGGPQGRRPEENRKPSGNKPAGHRSDRPRPQHPAPRPTPVSGPTEPMRIAKALARAGLCSRRDAERWIGEGRVKVNGRILTSPALDVGPKDRIEVDGKPLPSAEPPRLWRFNKPRGLVTTHRDPEGRPTVFDMLPPELPRVVSVGRLDFNTEGLLLLTNDGGLARHMELPATGWLRRYRVRAHGRITQADLDRLKEGTEIEGVRYGPIDATLDSTQGANVWLTIGLREGKNREVRKILATLGLDVNRLIRISFGPFQLLELAPGTVEQVRRRVLADQLGPTLAAEFGLRDDPETIAAPPRPRPTSHRPKPRRPERPRPDGKNRGDRPA